jgi:hypothetical protein
MTIEKGRGFEVSLASQGALSLFSLELFFLFIYLISDIATRPKFQLRTQMRNSLLCGRVKSNTKEGTQ